MTEGRALITGDAGFIGRHMRAALEERAWHIIGIDPKRNSATGRHDCRTIFQHYGPPFDPPFDLVVHCAAVVGGREQIDGDPLSVAENLELDAAMFRWAARGGAKRVIYWSSSAVYPVLAQNVRHARPLGERVCSIGEAIIGTSGLGMPDQTYGWAKLTGEVLADHARRAGVKVHVLRPFSGYGSDQDDTYPFGAFIDRALRRDDPFEVWGGDQVRDFVHVDDIVATALTMMDSDYPGPLNVGTGVGTSLTHLADLVVTAAGYRPTFAHRADKPQGVNYRVADTMLSHDLHKPRVTLAAGIIRALEERGA